mgnify:CR=1 FL=1
MLGEVVNAVMTYVVPGWGAWIEMEEDQKEDQNKKCRAPYGARGLKFSPDGIYQIAQARVAPRMGRVD